MRVGFITSEYPHPEVNKAAGIATSLKNLVNELSNKEIEITVFVYGQNSDKVLQESNVELHLIKSRRYKMFTWYFYRKYIQDYVNKIVNKKQIAILEAPDWTGITAFMKFKVPLVIRFHGSDAYFCKLDDRKQKLKNFIFEKLALKKANAYIAPTAFAGEETRKIFGLRKDKIKTIHYGLKLDQFNNAFPGEYDRYTILYIGTVIRKKGVLELAEIFNKVVAAKPESKLFMIGSDAPDIKTGNTSTYSLMKALFSDKAKENSHYYGKVPYNEVQDHIKKAHVCVFPSFAETLGMVTIESMALQKPVVNTSIGWAQELIDDGVSGYLVHPKQVDEYANRILELFDDEALCLTLGKAARIRVETLFDIEKNAAINIDYYKEVLYENNNT